MGARNRFLILLCLLPVLLLAATGIYMLGMALLEDDPRGFWSALEFAAETITTTGYGSDTGWTHPAMVLFVVGLQFLGVALIYVVVPIYLLKFLEERFEARLPRQAPKMRDHVVIYRYGPAVETLCDELAESGVPLVVVETSRETARSLRDHRIPVVYEDSPGPALDNVHLGDARALITNGSDEENAAAILVARQLGFKGEIFALVEEPYHRKPIVLAGATAAMTPRHVLGAALAARASQRISPRVSGIQQLGKKLEVREVRIHPASPLAGRTLAETRIGSRTGAIVIGRWVRGHLEPQPAAANRLEPRGILVAVGSAASLEQLRELAGSGRGKLGTARPFIVAGWGEVGQKVGQLLRDAGEEVRVIDRHPRKGVDVEGDILDPRVLESLDVDAAQGVILALDSDRATLFATVIVKDLAPEVPIIARVNAAENVDRIHHAGADFALSISQVSGKILAARLLRQVSVELDTKLRVLRVVAPGLDDRRPSALNIRGRTGCSVVAVERGEELAVDLGADFTFEPDDAIYICGTKEATRKFSEVYR